MSVNCEKNGTLVGWYVSRIAFGGSVFVCATAGVADVNPGALSKSNPVRSKERKAITRTSYCPSPHPAMPNLLR